MACSVVIAAYNEENNIADCIKSLLNQTYKPDEIIVINDGSTDKTAEIASKFPVKLITTKNQERSKARNLGVSKAKYPYVLIAETDAVFSKNWVEEILKEFKKGADAVIDRRAVYKPKTYFQKCWDAYFTIRYSNYKPFSAWAFKKELFLKLGGFDPKLKVGEDSDLGKRLLKNGSKIFLAKKAFQYHKGEPKNIIQLAKRAYKFNKEKAKYYYKKHKKDFPMKRLLFFILLCSLFILIALYNIKFIAYLIVLIYLAFFLKVGHFEKGFKEIKTKYIFGIAFNKFINYVFSNIGLVVGKLTRCAE